MNTGIYSIKNISTSHIYIGQSVELKRRIRRHKQKLRYNTHENDYLQKHYNKYGEECFVFDIIEICDIDTLDEREVFWIRHYESLSRDKGYNLESGGNPQKKLSEETKEKKRGANNPMYGRKWSEKQRTNIPIANRANSQLLTQQDVYEIKHQLISGVERKFISETHNIDITTVSKIVKCKNWSWVCPELNEALMSLWGETIKLKRKKAIQLRLSGWNIRDIANELHMTSKDIINATKKEMVQNAIQ